MFVMYSVIQNREIVVSHFLYEGCVLNRSVLNLLKVM